MIDFKDANYELTDHAADNPQPIQRETLAESQTVSAEEDHKTKDLPAHRARIGNEHSDCMKDNEEVLLGKILAFPDIFPKALTTIGPYYVWRDPLRQAIWNALIKLREMHVSIGPVAVLTEVMRTGVEAIGLCEASRDKESITKIDVVDYIRHLAEYSSNDGDWNYYIEKLRERDKKDRLADMLECAVRDSLNGKSSSEILHNVKSDLDAFDAEDDPDIELLRTSDLSPEPMKWVWPGYLPQQCVAIFDGNPGLGKSHVLLDLAMRHSTGTPWPLSNDQSRRDPQNTLMMADEDLLQQIIIPRLDVIGADRSRIFILKGRKEALQFPKHLARLKDMIVAEEISLVQIDPVFNYCDKTVNTYNDAEVRNEILHPMGEIAEKHDVSFILARHVIKQAAGRKSIHAGGGSIGFSGLARNQYLACNDPDSDAYCFAVGKASWSEKPDTLRYELLLTPNGYTRVHWIDRSKITADELLGAPNMGGNKVTCADLVQGLHADGDLTDRQVFEVAKRQFSEKTVRNVFSKLGLSRKAK